MQRFFGRHIRRGLRRIQQAQRGQLASHHGFRKQRHLFFTLFTLRGFARNWHFYRRRRLNKDRLGGFGPFLLDGGFTLLGNFLADTAILPAFDSTATAPHRLFHQAADVFKQHDPWQTAENTPTQQQQAADNQGGAGKTEGIADHRCQAFAQYPPRAHGQGMTAGMEAQCGKSGDTDQQEEKAAER